MARQVKARQGKARKEKYEHEEVIQQVKSLVDSLPTQYALTIAYLLLKLLELILEDYVTPLFFDTEDSDSPDSVTPRTF